MRKTLFSVCCSCSAWSPPCVPNPPPGRGPNPNLTVSTVVSGLDHPWDIAFTPDGQWMIFDERVGTIWAKNHHRRRDAGSSATVGRRRARRGWAPRARGRSELRKQPLPVRVLRHRRRRPRRALHHRPVAELARGGYAAVVTGMPVNTATGQTLRLPSALPAGHQSPQLFVGTGDTATDGTHPAEPALPRRQGAVRDDRRQPVCEQPRRREPVAGHRRPHLVVGSPQRARNRVLPPRRRRLHHRARHRSRRRGQRDVPGQLRLGPGAVLLRRIAPDDRAGRDRSGLELGLPDDRAVGRRRS